VEKFELSPEEYEKRTGPALISLPDSFGRLTPLVPSGTLKAYKQHHKLGRFASPSPPSTSPPASAGNISLIDQCVGSRCQVRDAGGPQRRGTIRFVGRTRFGKQDESTWVGIELDNPLGRNDGL
jgi:tubulin-folding cofactor B